MSAKIPEIPRGEPSPSQPFAVTRGTDCTATISVDGPVTVANQRRLCELIVSLARDGVTNVLIDFRGCRYIDGRGLGALVGCKKMVQGLGSAMAVTNVSDEVQSLFKLTKVDAVLTRS